MGSLIVTKADAYSVFFAVVLSEVVVFGGSDFAFSVVVADSALVVFSTGGEDTPEGER